MLASPLQPFSMCQGVQPASFDDNTGSESGGGFLRPDSRRPHDTGLCILFGAANDFLTDINGLWWQAGIEHLYHDGCSVRPDRDTR